MRIDPSKEAQNASRVILSIDPKDITFQQGADNRFLASLDIVFVQETKRGKAVTDLKETVNVKATPEQYEAIQQQGLAAGRDLKIAPDTDTVRVVVLDRNSGETGSVTVPFEPADKSPSTT